MLAAKKQTLPFFLYGLVAQAEGLPREANTATFCTRAALPCPTPSQLSPPFLFYSYPYHSGMVVQTIKEGTGATPLPTDTVKASTPWCCL